MMNKVRINFNAPGVFISSCPNAIHCEGMVVLPIPRHHAATLLDYDFGKQRWREKLLCLCGFSENESRAESLGNGTHCPSPRKPGQ
jgi:hypothetical protein